MSLRDEIRAKTTEELWAMIPHGAVSQYQREIAIYEIQRRGSRLRRPRKKQPGEGKLTMGLLRAQADYIEQTFGISIDLDLDEDDAREVSPQEVDETYRRARVVEPEADQPEGSPGSF